MKTEVITQRPDILIRRMVLEPGEAMPWHTDPVTRFTVVVSGEALRIEMRESGETFDVAVRPGLADWDQPEPKVHRAVNVGAGRYEEVVTFHLDAPGQDPQPEA